MPIFSRLMFQSKVFAQMINWINHGIYVEVKFMGGFHLYVLDFLWTKCNSIPFIHCQVTLVQCMDNGSVIDGCWVRCHIHPPVTMILTWWKYISCSGNCDNESILPILITNFVSLYLQWGPYHLLTIIVNSKTIFSVIILI